LVSGVETVGRSGIEIVSASISKTLGRGAEFLLFILVFAFAYSTVVCWYYYGSECIKFITGKVKSYIFTALFVSSVFGGFLVPSSLLISATDYILFFMTLLTLATLKKNSERIVSLSEKMY
jgi:AGCS family alanine or glycine:cation symporter